MATGKKKTRGYAKEKVRASAKETARADIPARVRVALTPGDSVRLARELQEMTQEEPATASGIPQPTMPSIESGRATRRGAGREARAGSQGPSGGAALAEL